MGKKVLSVYVLVLLFILGLNYTVHAATTGKIAGTVVDKSTGDPLPGVNVLVPGTQLGAATDVGGRYYIINMPPDVYNVSAQMIGYATVNQTSVIVNVDRTTTLDFELDLTVLQGEEITIVAERAIVPVDVSASQQVISSESVEAFVKSTPVGSVGEMINMQAGVENMIIRGGGRDQTGFMVDGLMMVDERRNEPVMRVNLSSVKEVEILTGGFNAEFGNIRSGLLNVITKGGEVSKYSGSIDFRYSPAARKHFGEEYWKADWKIYGGEDAIEGNEYFEGGWTEFVEGTGRSPEEVQALWQWIHRPLEYANKPDYNIDASFSGPVPLLTKLRPTTFFASYTRNNNMFLFPQARDGVQYENTQLSLTSRISPEIRLNIFGLYGELNTLRFGSSENLSNIRDNWGAMWYQGGTNSYNIGGTTLANQYTSLIGIKLNHTLSPSTFYELKLQRFWQHDHVDKQANRDTSKVYEYYPGFYADEAPLGFYPAQNRDQLGYYFTAGGGKLRDFSNTETISFKADLTSQVDHYNQIKTGVEFVYNFLDEHSGVYGPFHNQHDDWYIWQRFPKRAGAYIQDKFEWEGMIANFGLRADYTDADVDWYTVDPYSKYLSAAYKDSLDQAPTEPSKSRLRFSPRLGISHPISENTKIFFNYGHFYSMPRNEALYSIQHGFQGDYKIQRLGNPNLNIPRTVAYELGYDQNLFDQILLHVAGYYKDVTDQTGELGYHNRDNSVSYQTYESKNYADIRGFEIRAEKKYGQFWWGWLNYNYVLTSNGYIGFQDYYEDPRIIPVREGAEQFKSVAQPSFRTCIEFHTPIDWGPRWLGLKPLSGWSANMIYFWQEGGKFTWEPIDPSDKNNMQWVTYSNANFRITKTFDSVFGVNSEFFLIVNNLFNTKRLNRWAFDSNEWTEYLRSLKLSWEEGDEKGSDRVGEWDEDYIDTDVRTPYLLYLNPRDFYLGVRLYF